MFRLTPVVKNLLLINVVVFVLQMVVRGVDVTSLLSMHQISSDEFRPYQFFTYMFAHGGFMHIAFNMLGLVFLGPMLESFWGPKRFLTFYLITGIGAGVLFAGIQYYQTNSLKNEVETYISSPSSGDFVKFVDKHDDKIGRIFDIAKIREFVEEYDQNPDNPAYINDSQDIAKKTYQMSIGGIMLGASGAIYGILMAFGLLFPNTQLMLLFPPIPIKAKYLVLGLGAFAIYQGFSKNPGDNVAHFAHLGGMIFAFIMIKIWQSGRNKFY